MNRSAANLKLFRYRIDQLEKAPLPPQKLLFSFGGGPPFPFGSSSKPPKARRYSWRKREQPFLVPRLSVTPFLHRRGGPMANSPPPPLQGEGHPEQRLGPSSRSITSQPKALTPSSSYSSLTTRALLDVLFPLLFLCTRFAQRLAGFSCGSERIPVN